MKYGIYDNKGNEIARTDSPESASLIRDLLNQNTKVSGIRYIVRTA